MRLGFGSAVLRSAAILAIAAMATLPLPTDVQAHGWHGGGHRSFGRDDRRFDGDDRNFRNRSFDRDDRDRDDRWSGHRGSWSR